MLLVVALSYVAARQIQKKLTILDLSGCSLHDAGAKAVAEMLSVNESITELNLSWNRVAAEGAIAVARSLAKVPSLRKLNLGWNSFHDTVSS